VVVAGIPDSCSELHLGACYSQACIMYAEITTEGEGRVVCQRCKESFPPGTELKYVGNKDSMQSGRKVCDSCHGYYLNKPTTQRRPFEG